MSMPRHTYYRAYSITDPWKRISRDHLRTALNQSFPPHEVNSMIAKIEHGDILETAHAFYKCEWKV